MTEVKKAEGGQTYFRTLVLTAESSAGHQIIASLRPDVIQDNFTARNHLLVFLQI